MSYVDYPLHFDARGRTATAGDADHVRDLIEQALFTTPTERAMRPDFGSGILALMFEPNSSALATTTQALVQSALQQHLGHLIAVQSVDVEPIDGRLVIDIAYALVSDGSPQHAHLVAPEGTP